MFFGICIGDDKSAVLWQDVVRQHVAWLGAASRAESFAAGGKGVHVVWAAARLPEPASGHPEGFGYLALTMRGGVLCASEWAEDQVRCWVTDEQSPVESRVAVSLQTGDLFAAVPPVSSEFLCYTPVSGGWALSNDLRFLARLVGADLDEYGVFSLFRHAIVVPPATLFKNIRCVPGGHLLRIGRGSEAPTLEVFFHLEPPPEGPPQPAAAEAKVRDTLDEILASTPSSSIVYFSGGMDSSLIAARLAAMGRRDATLVNYAFGPQDEAGQKALKIAAHLGMRCEQFMWDVTSVPAVLERFGKDYPVPFGDPSMVPGNLIAHASLPLAEKSGMAIHGVGTGAMFGQRALLRKKLKPLYSIPLPLRQMCAEAYRWLGLWRHESQIERGIGFLRRSLESPSIVPPRAGQHPMNGIAYTMPDRMGERLEEGIRYYAKAFWAGPRPVQGLLNTMLILARQFSAIAAGPLGARGVRTMGAFTEPRMLRCAYALQTEEKLPGGVPRGVLKNLLSKSLPPEWIYVPGRSFIVP